MEPTKTIEYVEYVDESMIGDIQALVSKDLSEPYSIFTYRYFLHNWPSLCLCAYDSDPAGSGERDSSSRFMIGTIVCKAEDEQGTFRGYIAMLAVNSNYRKQGIGAKLVSMALDRMVAMGCEEITLETEASNQGALRLYERLGFLRDEKMIRYYLNSGDAYRLKLFVDPVVPIPGREEETEGAEQTAGEVDGGSGHPEAGSTTTGAVDAMDGGAQGSADGITAVVPSVESLSMSESGEN